ncbi:MAG: lysine--tRNA ligase [Candidatus Pacebacteria bacterium]|nr:lysine--tRNA ligase [Candidatus Paceibacterota bacterium]
MALEDIRNERLKKLELLREHGIDPYPATSGRTTTIAEATVDFDALSPDIPLTVAGRVMAFREHGGSLFIDVNDGTGKIQGYLKKDDLGDAYDLFAATVDVGDFVDVSGTPMRTKRGEPSIKATAWNMLSKSLHPLPDKWEGLTDPEERLRKRYLDILFDPAVRALIEQKGRFWNATRQFLLERGFIEVETPTLEVTTGGAEARPFITHHNDFDIDLYLRISVGELWQKRLMAAGLPRTFEIGRVYRNEGTSAEHVQEFTNLEFYAAYMDFEQGVSLTEEMIKEVVKDVFGKLEFSTKGQTINLSGTWERLDYVSTVKKMTGVDILTATENDMKEALTKLHVTYEGETRERLTDTLWKYCRKQISGPAWLINHPKLVSPLSKAHPDNPLLTQRAQLILAGSEMTNGFAELNDPLDQKERFTEQQKLIEAGDNEAMMPDFEFVEMLEHGMPPAFGFAYGDRLFSFLADKPIRETQIFPLMRPR